MKKLLLALGTVAAVVAPVASVVACGSTTTVSKSKAADIAPVFDANAETTKLEDIVNLGVKDLKFENTITYINKKDEEEADEELMITKGYVKVNFTATKDGEILGVKIKKDSSVSAEINFDKSEDRNEPFFLINSATPEMDYYESKLYEYIDNLVGQTTKVQPVILKRALKEWAKEKLTPENFAKGLQEIKDAKFVGDFNKTFKKYQPLNLDQDSEE